MELQQRVELIKAAIGRIEGLEAEWRDTEQNPAATWAERDRARVRYGGAEVEFGWQRNNVKALLEAWEKRQ